MTGMNTVDLIIKAISDYHSEIEADPNGRYRSWEHCTHWKQNTDQRAKTSGMGGQSDLC